MIADDIFYHFCSKHRLMVLIKNHLNKAVLSSMHNLFMSPNKKKITQTTVNPHFLYIKWGFTVCSLHGLINATMLWALLFYSTYDFIQLVKKTLEKQVEKFVTNQPTCRYPITVQTTLHVQSLIAIQKSLYVTGLENPWNFHSSGMTKV